MLHLDYFGVSLPACGALGDPVLVVARQDWDSIAHKCGNCKKWHRKNGPRLERERRARARPKQKQASDNRAKIIPFPSGEKRRAR